jgi:polyhydroxybutyrate depolymerase
MIGLWFACGSPVPQDLARAEPPRRGRGQRAAEVLDLVQVGPDARGEPRSYWVHVPEGAAGPLPALFLFHGGQGHDGKDMARYWKDQLDQGMILVFPNGQLTDPGVGGWVAERGDRHQVENVLRIVDRVVREHGADPDRLYAAGFSGGAEMVDQLACHAPTTFRAFGHVGRTLLQDVLDDCPDPTDRPQMVMQGLSDPSAPPEGKRDVDGARWRQVPSSQAWAFWLKAAGCGGEPTVRALPDQGDRAEIEVRTWTGCARAPGMRYVSMAGVGHVWPDGVEVRDIRATDAFLDFFREFGGL